MIASLTLAALPLLAPTTEETPDALVLADGKEVACRVLYEGPETIVYHDGKKQHERKKSEVKEVRSIERSLRTLLERYAESSTEEPAVLAELARFAEADELPGEAHALWIRVLALDPVNEEAWTKLGGTKSKKGEWRLEVRGRYYTYEELRSRAGDWKNALELRTAHFLVRTDLPPERAVELALNVERAYLAYYDLFTPHLPLYVFDEVPEVHVCADAKDFPAPPEPGQIAYFSLGENTLYVDGSKPEPTGAALVEAADLLTYNAFRRTLGKQGSMPGWLIEGIGQAFAIAARPAPGKLRFEFGKPYEPYFALVARDVAKSDLQRVLGTGRAGFRSGTDSERFAAEAYTLLNFLAQADGGKHRAGLARFLESAFKGQGAATHLEKALGMKLDEIEKGWKAYVASIAG